MKGGLRTFAVIRPILGIQLRAAIHSDLLPELLQLRLSRERAFSNIAVDRGHTASATAPSLLFLGGGIRVPNATAPRRQKALKETSAVNARLSVHLVATFRKRPVRLRAAVSRPVSSV